METKSFITLDECCNYYSVEKSFVQSLNEHGLLEFQQVNESVNIDLSDLRALEKFRMLYYDLDINMEGLEVIHRLLQRIEHLQATLRSHRDL